jgi:hypothetical protein
MIGLSTCEQCSWRPLTGHPAVRDEPWADVEAGYRYSYCEQCGNLTVHSYNPATGFGQVFMLDASAMALFRYDASPSAVSAYVLSQDYRQNSGVAEPLFRGYLRWLDDASGLANNFVALVEEALDVVAMLRMLELFDLVLAEAVRRYEVREGALVVRLVNVAPVLAVARGALEPTHHDPDRLAAARVVAWRVLERLGHPALWRALDDDRAEMVEEVTDHVALLELGRRGLERGLARVRQDGPVQLYIEAKFLKHVLTARGARLTDELAAIVWRAMQELMPSIGSSGAEKMFASRAFVRLRALLEHQLMALGLQKSGVDGTHAGLIEYVDPRSGRSVQMPPYRTRIYVYEHVDAPTPAAVIEEWDLLRRHLFR